jgi:hypothetical protein
VSAQNLTLLQPRLRQSLLLARGVFEKRLCNAFKKIQSITAARQRGQRKGDKSNFRLPGYIGIASRSSTAVSALVAKVAAILEDEVIYHVKIVFSRKLILSELLADLTSGTAPV